MRLWLDRFQIPVSVASLALGGYWISAGVPIIGVGVMLLGVSAAALAIRRLRR